MYDGSHMIPSGWDENVNIQYLGEYIWNRKKEIQ